MLTRRRRTPEAPADWSPEGIRRLYTAHVGELYGYAVRALRDPGRAEDAVQETFTRAWRARDRYDAELGGVRTWLFAILRRVVIDAAVAAGHQPTPIPDVPEQPTEGVESALDGWVVEEGLRRIRAEHRVVLIETYFRGRSYADVAADLGIPVTTARTRAFYGLRALRVALLEMGWEE